MHISEQFGTSSGRSNMSLDKVTIPVDFKGGQDGKSSANSIPIGQLALLQNCVRRKTGRIDKRFGHEALSTDVVTPTATTISGGQRLFAYRDELGLISDDMIFTYSPGLEKWSGRGSWAVPTASVSFSFSNSFDQALYDFASVGGVSCYVWVDRKIAAVTLRCEVVDDTTGAILLHDAEISSSGDMPKVVVVNGYFVIYYIRAGSIYTRRILKNSPTALTTEQLVDSTVNGIYDITSWGGVVGVAAVPTTTNTIKLFYFGEDGIPNAATYATTAVVATRGDGAITVVVCPSLSRIYLGYTSSGGAEANTTRIRIFDMNFVGIANLNASSVLSRNITIACKDSGEAIIFLEVAAAASYNHYVGSARFTLSGFVPGGSRRTNSVGLGTKAFINGDNYYAVLTHDSALQPTYFLVSGDGLVCGKFLYATGGGLSRANTSGASFSRALHSGLPAVYIGGTSTSVLLQSASQLLAADDGTTFSQNYNIRRYDLSFNNPYQSAEFGEANYFAGAIVGEYDGVSAVESGFNLFPENTTASVAGVDGSLSVGTYYVSVVYEWVNARGEREQSAPSIPISQAVGATQHLAVVVPTLRVTNKQSANTSAGRADVVVVLYRSQVDDPTIFYRDVLTKNDPTVDTVTLTSIASDASIGTKEILYTVGGELDNIGAPSCSAVTRYNNRLIAVGLEDGNTAAFSKEQRSGDAAAFVIEFVVNVEPRGGRIYSAAALDDKLILFKRSSIYNLVGDGPARNGQFNDFQSPRLVTADVGCVNPVSIVSTPLGLMFQSAKGIYLLDRGLGTRYIGDRVENYNDLTVTSAVVIEDTNEVRFTTEDTLLVYNYYYDEWSVFSNYSANSALSHSTLGYCHLKSTGEVRRETSAYLDEGARIISAIETGWLPFAGVLGFQRIWNIYCIGEYISQHYAKVSLAYDRENVFNEIRYFDTRDVVTDEAFGDSSPFGEGGFGDGSQVYQWQLKPRKQKCETIKVRIEDIDTITAAGGGSVSINNLMFEVGVKVGGTKSFRRPE